MNKLSLALERLLVNNTVNLQADLEDASFASKHEGVVMPLSTAPRKLPTHKDQEYGTFPDNLAEAFVGGVIMVLAGIASITSRIIGRKKRPQEENIDSPNIWMK